MKSRNSSAWICRQLFEQLNITYTKKIVQVLEQASNKVGLKINSKKTKMMKLLENEGSVDDDDNENIMLEKANEF